MQIKDEVDQLIASSPVVVGSPSPGGPDPGLPDPPGHPPSRVRVKRVS